MPVPDDETPLVINGEPSDHVSIEDLELLIERDSPAAWIAEGLLDMADEQLLELHEGEE